MKLNYFTKQLSVVGRWVATALFCTSAFIFVWQGTYLNTSAFASPASTLIATSDAGDNVKYKTSEDAGRAKGFVENTKDFVKDAAKSNASKVDDVTDNNSIARKAKSDAATIQRRAEEDAARTENAIDNTKNAVQRTVDNIKDAFSS
ncbi:MAG: hypothetical protein IGS39_18270 [Calothrix sp. C42_A2020_038]|nr:hypothetical protein [Calothrix sp. C42_A2020_038]